MPAKPDQDVNARESKAICACDIIVDDWAVKEARAACVGEAVYAHEGKSFCVMHYPSQNKIEAFRVALKQKIEAEDFNFYGVYFPEEIYFPIFPKNNTSSSVDFSSATFSSNVNFIGTFFGIDVSFTETKFKGVAKFQLAKFGAKVTFRSTEFFATTYFSFVEFENTVNFTNAKFQSHVSFLWVTFCALTLFEGISLKGQMGFRNAQFKDYVKFKGNENTFGKDASLSFDSLRIEKPERLSFHSVKLRPHWFINTDPRKFEFIDVRWDDDLTKERSASKSDLLLSVAYRQLAMNAEENNRYDEAIKFRYASMETTFLSSQKKWLEDWFKQHFGRWSFETFSWWPQ